MEENTYTYQEIASQSRVWKETLADYRQDQEKTERFLASTKFNKIVTTGCGSTHYLAQAAALLLSQVGKVSSQALPASEVWLLPRIEWDESTLLVAVSRSGTTTETLNAIQRFRQEVGGGVLVVTCDPDSPMAALADYTLAASTAQEKSVAQTRSFNSMYILLQALSASLGKNDAMLNNLFQLPALLEEMIDNAGDLPRRLGENLALENIYFLGGGALYGIACEAMLKMKEMTLTQTEAFYPLEFRHGPMSMVDEKTLVVSLLSDTGRDYEISVLEDMSRLGAQTLALSSLEGFSKQWEPDDMVVLGNGLNDWERGALYLAFLQYVAYYRSLAKGLNPDQPRHLAQVVYL